MEEAKGTYYSPQETGWATVLRPGPNLLGVAQQQQALVAKRDQLATQQRARLDAEREKQAAKIVADLSKPVPTAFPYQEEVNKRKAALLQQAQDMFLKNADAAEIRFKIANGVQEMLAFANSGKQVYEGILSQTKQLDGKKYKIDEINKGLVDKIIGPEGSVLDPSKVDPRDLSATELVYSSKRPWDYLNQNVVVGDFLKNDKFKEVLMEVQRNADAGRIGRFTTFDKTTNIAKAVGPLYDVNPISGEVKLNDPETLVENGVYQLAMNDRDMAAVIEGEVQRLTENRLTPIDGDAKRMLEASVLQDLLVGSTPGPTTIERVTRKVAPTTAGSRGGRLTQREINEMEDVASVNKWKQDVSSSEPFTVREALEYLNVQLGISDDARTALVEAIDAPAGYELKDVQLVDDSKLPSAIIAARKMVGMGARKQGIYAVFENSQGKKQYRPINQDLLGEFGSQVYSTAFKRTGRNYKQELPGVVNGQQVAPAAQQSAPKFSIFKK